MPWQATHETTDPEQRLFWWFLHRFTSLFVLMPQSTPSLFDSNVRLHIFPLVSIRMSIAAKVLLNASEWRKKWRKEDRHFSILLDSPSVENQDNRLCPDEWRYLLPIHNSVRIVCNCWIHRHIYCSKDDICCAKPDELLSRFPVRPRAETNNGMACECWMQSCMRPLIRCWTLA